jgi:lysozyme family protein
MASVALTGTLFNEPIERSIVNGGFTLILTLTDDTWVTAGATFNAQRQNIINGITSAQSETHGWNNEVRDVIAVTTVVRTSNTVVTITLPAEDAYDITSAETITATVPATALVGAGALVASPTIAIVQTTNAIAPVSYAGGILSTGFGFY